MSLRRHGGSATVSSDPFKDQYAYSYGILTSVKDFNASTTVLWNLNATNERGQPIDETLGNGVHVISGFDSLTGFMSYRWSGNNATYDNQQKLSYNWNLKGSLSDRIDANQANLTEKFVYDGLNRLDYSTLNGTQEAGERVLAQLAGGAAMSDVLDGVRHRPGR